jgi:hypothetical protein
MRFSTVSLVNSFSRKTRGEKPKCCISASLPLSKKQANSVCVKVRRVKQGGKVMNRLEVHGSNSTSDRAVHVGVEFYMTSKAADGMRSRTKRPCFEATMSRMASSITKTAGQTSGSLAVGESRFRRITRRGSSTSRSALEFFQNAHDCTRSHKLSFSAWRPPSAPGSRCRKIRRH